MTKIELDATKYAEAMAMAQKTTANVSAYREFTGSFISAALLTRIISRWDHKGNKKFYKFKQFCDHDLSVKGDSWCEELGITKKEFEAAIKKIGFKKGKNKNLLTKENAIVWYYTDNNNVTWYEFRREQFNKKMHEYLINKELGLTTF